MFSFFLTVNENVAMILLLFTLVGLSLSKQKKKIFCFVIIYSSITTISLFLINSIILRCILNIITHYILIFYIFNNFSNLSLLLTILRLIIQILIESILYVPISYIRSTGLGLHLLSEEILITISSDVVIGILLLILHKTRFSLEHIYLGNHKYYTKYLNYM